MIIAGINNAALVKIAMKPRGTLIFLHARQSNRLCVRFQQVCHRKFYVSIPQPEILASYVASHFGSFGV
ncbi:hypothetical protein Nepgr_003571 [Nepenthes gracilis]|uniref:Uncharacterized protein n=1 Tax=Nepenthes gracilis TaxID=150966 RepID=A0AAD3RZU2_NEPGR|nr:hypothetical protein Nepgr_003571 [Nepenthes gracilis]